MQHIYLKQTNFINFFQIRQYERNEINFVAGEDGIVGRGTYGRVQLAYHRVQQWIAVKCFKIDNNYERIERKSV